MTTQIRPLHPYLVALQTATGAVTFLVTRHPAIQIDHMGRQLEVARHMVVTTNHAERVMNELAVEFGEKLISTFGEHPYYLVDWEEAVRVIDEFDHATGQRMRRGDVAVGDQVQVDITTAAPHVVGKRKGEVTGISGRRYLVRLLEPIGDFTGMWAPRSQIKLVVRCLALAGA
jgi:hypothetical protein